MKYEEAMEWLEKLAEKSRENEPQENQVKAAVTEEFCRELFWQPVQTGQQTLIVEVCGLKGKSSVMTLLAAVLQESKYRVGCLYTQGLAAYADRICVNGKAISKKAIAQGVEWIRDNGKKWQEEDRLTFDMAHMALALWYFRQKQCGIILVERPAVTDAVKWSGAAQVICGEGDPADRCRMSIRKQWFDYHQWKKVVLAAGGAAQIENGVTVLKAVEELKQKGFRIDSDAVYKALAKTLIPCRMEVLRKKPLFLADAATDQVSSQMLWKTVEQCLDKKRLIMILGITRRMDLNLFSKELLERADMIIAVTPPRYTDIALAGFQIGIPSWELAEQIAKVHPGVTAVDSVEEALEIAGMLAGKEDVILAVGALSYLGRVRSLLLTRKK